MAYQQLRILSDVDMFGDLIKAGGGSLTSGQLDAVTHYFLLLSDKQIAGGPAQAPLPGLSSPEQRERVKSLLPYVDLDQLLDEVMRESAETKRRQALGTSGSLPMLPHGSSAGSDSSLEESGGSGVLTIGDDSARLVKGAPAIAVPAASGSGTRYGASASFSANELSAAAPEESPRVVETIGAAFKRFWSTVEGDDAVSIHEAMALATDIVAHRDAPIAAPLALYAEPISDVAIAIAPAADGSPQAHLVVDEAAVVNARAAARAWCQCPKKLKLSGMGIVALVYGFNYALVAGYEAFVVTEDIGFSVFCAAASFCANFAQIFATLEKLRDDVSGKFTTISQATHRAAPWVLFCLALPVALAAAIPVGSSILSAFRYLEGKGMNMGEANQIVPALNAAFMYAMRTVLVVRGMFNMPGSMSNKAKLFCYSGRRGDIATISAAGLGFAAALVIGVLYSHGQIKTTTDFLGELWPSKFSSGSSDENVAYAIALFGFVGSSFLNINYVGNGTQSFLNLIFSMQGATKLVSFLFLLAAIPTLFPGVAFVTGGLGTKIMGGIATWMSNYASYLDLGVIGKSLKYSAQRGVLHEQVDLLTGLSRLLEIAVEEGEGHIRAAGAGGCVADLRQLVDSYKKDQVYLDAMVRLLNTLISTMDQKDVLNVCMQGAREKVQQGLRTCLNARASAEVGYARISSCFSSRGYQRLEGDNAVPLLAQQAEAVDVPRLPSYLGGGVLVQRRQAEPRGTALSRVQNVRAHSLQHMPRSSPPSSNPTSATSSPGRAVLVGAWRATALVHEATPLTARGVTGEPKTTL